MPNKTDLVVVLCIKFGLKGEGDVEVVYVFFNGLNPSGSRCPNLGSDVVVHQNSGLLGPLGDAQIKA